MTDAVKMAIEALTDIRTSIECAAGCDEGIDPMAAISEIMSAYGTAMASAYSRAADMLNILAALEQAVEPSLSTLQRLGQEFDAAPVKECLTTATDAGGVTEDDVIGLINIVTDLAEVDALDKAYPEVWGRLDAMVNHAVAAATAAKDAAIRARDDHFRNAQRLADKLVAKEAKIARLREALERIQPVACGDWCRDDKHIPECENALAALSEAREAGE